MDIFCNISYESPTIHFRTKNEAEEVFGVAHSFIKSLWILESYKSKGGVIVAEEKLPYKDYRFIKGNIEFMHLEAGRFNIHNQISYTESFLDDESPLVVECAEKSLASLRKLVDDGFKKKIFEEIYSDLVLL